MTRSFLVGILLASRVWKMILLLVVANLLFSLPAAVLVFLLVAQTTSGTLAAREMFADKLDINWITDVFNHQMPWPSLESTGIQVAALLALMGASYLLLNTLLAGGIIGVFASDDGRFTMPKFWWGCGAYFWRFLRLVLISIAFYLAAFLLYYLARSLFGGATQQATTYESVIFKRWALMLLLIILFLFVNMIFDYARIGTVVNDSRKMFRETARACRFSLRHFFGAFGLYLLVGITGLVLFASLAWLRSSIDQRSIIAVLLAMIVGQLAIASRMWTRLAFYAAELNFYRRYYPLKAPIVAPVADTGVEFLAATGGGTGEGQEEVDHDRPQEVVTESTSGRPQEERGQSA